MSYSTTAFILKPLLTHVIFLTFPPSPKSDSFKAYMYIIIRATGIENAQTEATVE